MPDEESEPLALQLARDGVDSEAAFRAATEAEKARVEAERKEMENQSTLEIVLQEVDIGQVMQQIIKAASTAALTGQQSRQQPVQPQQVNQPQNEQSRPSEEPSPAESPLREDSEEIEINDSD